MNKQEEVFKIRHSLAHLLAAAVIKNKPEAKISIGPVIDNGFYYDIDFGDENINDKDLKIFQKNIKKLISKKLDFSREEVSADEAREIFVDNPYKKELIDNLEKEGQEIAIYKTGDVFVDLCEGPHVENTSQIDATAFKLTKVAGAYWRGDEKNKMLTRIYGIAFQNKEELDEYENMLAEAEKRDHRKLGKELGLFSFSPLVGPGLPLWTPKGTILRNEIDKFVEELREEKGYQKVTIPHITKDDLYKKSGHYDKFAEELFKVKSREGKGYFLKPMNCPHHTQIFDAFPKTYRDMPQRYSETTMVYRDEQSGELGGLTRVLSITQDDAHVFARESQVKEEVNAIWDIIDKFYKAFGFSEMKVRLSFHDPKEMDKYLGTEETWQISETAIKEIAEERGAEYFIGVGEAAMYGPKLDFIVNDSLGRIHQVATIQLDRNMPERFELSFINEKGEKERPVMIHAAIAGSLERFTAVMIEHTAGNFPFRFSPVQTVIVPVADAHLEYCSEIFRTLKEEGFRVKLDDSKNSMGKKIRIAKKNKTPYIIIIGDKDIKEKKITLESRDTEKSEQISLEEAKKKLREKNK